ncbi:major histocompatibility complex class I-related gene protein-like isoform X2 [Hemicordylus capensis]|uniref:major histocompatibility complex class I-related gene protein-like isoform X2 n=1 Tax=Hemicordylus capensis TaxID=884348 RepID=UPI0023041D2E|nr:major histocompatibility complex class I-related gene protein-like isoform X2 [Hemicordylus capensis]
MRRLRDWCFLHLRAAVLLVLQERGSSGSSSHSLTFFSALMSKPIPGTHPFTALVYLDDQLIGHYDSNRRKCLPEPSWAEKVEEEEDAPFWDWCTKVSLTSASSFRVDFLNLQKYYNQSRRLHIWQRMHGCALSGDGLREAHYQYAYDGRDFLSLDMETLTWTAADVMAQLVKRRWEAHPLLTQNKRYFTEEKCEWLKKFFQYGKEALLRREPPVVKVRRKAGYDGWETLICRLYGFYPKEIDATWRKDGEVWEQETFRGGITPNSGGTYHTWLSIEIDPKDRDQYRCYVEHDALEKPVDLAWEEPVNLQKQEPYKAASTSDLGSDNSCGGSSQQSWSNQERIP